MGPGDPLLLTRQAMAVLGSADRVVAPTGSADEPGRAESVVLQAMPEISITRLPFDMTPDVQGGLLTRAASHREVARKLLPWLSTGEEVAFITLGDPNIYSTFSALVLALRQLGWEGAVETVPGITAFQALASRTGTVLLDGTESLSLVTALDGTTHVEEALREPDRAVVVYKGGKHLPEIAALLSSVGRLEGAVFGEHIGLEGEWTGPLAEVPEHSASYLATVIVPPLTDSEGQA